MIDPVIGIAGPVSLELLDFPQGTPSHLPEEYSAPIVSHYVNALLRRGFRVVVYTTARGIDGPVVVDQDRLVVCFAPRGRPRSAVTLFSRERAGLGRLMRHYPADVLHAMWSYEFALAALDSGRPTVVHYRDNARVILRHNRDAYRLLRWLLSEVVTQRAEHKIANSHYLKASFGRRGRHMAVVPNFLPSGYGTPPPRPPSSRPYVVTVSNGFAGQKNIAAALHAFRHLLDRGLIAEYRLIGAGLGRGEEAELYARRHDLHRGTRFVGSLPYAATIAEIAGAAVLLHPALEESFGMTVLEAMATRVIVVGGRESGAVPELLDNGRCGLLCDVTDPLSMAGAVTTAMHDDAGMDVLRKRAEERYSAHYSEDAVTKQLLSIYASVLPPTTTLDTGS